MRVVGQATFPRLLANKAPTAVTRPPIITTHTRVGNHEN